MSRERDLVGEAYSALEWCVEVIGEDDLNRGDIPPEHKSKLEEIDVLLAQLAEVIDPAAKIEEKSENPLKQVDITMSNGRKYTIKRIL